MTIEKTIMMMDKFEVINSVDDIMENSKLSISISDGEHVGGTEYELMIIANDEMWMPTVEIDANNEILDLHCQCCKDGKMCEHKILLLLLMQQDVFNEK